MKRKLLPYLICPACLPKEVALDLSAGREEDGDILSGGLFCRKCSRRFPIRDGIAFLTPHPENPVSGGQLRYEDPAMTGRYLWSHYGDLAGVADFGSANDNWAQCLSTDRSALSFDAGCSVGRITFEMAARSGFAVGCDLSHGFIRTARRLAKERQLKFTLPLEGNLQESFQVTLPDNFPSDTVEFVLADALRIPFAADTFSKVTSMNLLDRVSYPLAHLFEMNRVAGSKKTTFLFADPFSWSVDAAPEELWLGGTAAGTYQGRGVDNVRLLLEGKGKVLMPPWAVDASGSIAWKLRTHRNHHEVITSEYLLASR